MRSGFKICLAVALATGFVACKSKPAAKADSAVIFKGLYSYGPEVKSFKECANGREYWVADSSAQLELQYTQLAFEKENEPVYVEVSGEKIITAKDGPGSGYDSTLVVRKLIKLVKDIPKGACN